MHQESRSLRRHVPNALTGLRLLLACAFVGVLGSYSFPDINRWALPVATALFIVAAATDALDGYLARRWNAVSVFGRVMDPFADKVLVLGAFIILASPVFRPFYDPLETASWLARVLDEQPGTFLAGLSPAEVPDAEFIRYELGVPMFFLHSLSGVAPWMAIVILARELLVTSIRGAFESRGIDFSASASGKLKMILQSLGVPVLLLSTWLLIGDPFADARTAYPQGLAGADPGALDAIRQRVGLGLTINRVTAIVVTLVTAFSALPYVARAITIGKGSSPA